MQRVIRKVPPNFLRHLGDSLLDTGVGNQHVQRFAGAVPVPVLCGRLVTGFAHSPLLTEVADRYFMNS
jgi:hypothetical protein